MDNSWVTRALIPASVAIAFALFRKFAPAKKDPTLERFDSHNGKRLPTGAFGAITFTMGVVIAVGGFFLLRSVNHLFAKLDGHTLLHIFPVTAIWCFLPCFAALAIPWPFTIYILRRSSYTDEAAYIEAEASQKSGFDCYRVMKGMVFFLVSPIALFTFLAIPERLTFTDSDIRWTPYASLRSDVYKYSDARSAYLIDGYELRDGSFEKHFDLLIEFSDGRRLSANAVGDGGSEPSKEEINLVLAKTGLSPIEVRTLNDIH